MTLPLQSAPLPLRIEITMPGRDTEGHPSFALMFVDEGRRTLVWSGPDYGEAILAAEEWELDDFDVVDTVADGAGAWGFA